MVGGHDQQHERAAHTCRESSSPAFSGIGILYEVIGVALYVRHGRAGRIVMR